MSTNVKRPDQMTRRTFVAASAGGAAALSMPWVSRAYGAETIPIGVVVGLTGRAASYGVSTANAIRLIVDEVNKNGGIKSKGGAKIELFVADHQSQASVAGTLTERMIEVNKVLAVAGNATSAATVVGSKIAEAGKCPMLSPDTADELSEMGHKYYFRLGPKSSSLAAAAVDFAADAAKATGVKPNKVAIMADDTSFSQSSAKGLLKALPKTGWTLAENVSYPAGGLSDFTSIIQRLKLTGVDLVFHSTFPPDGIQITRAMKAVDYNPIAAIHVSGAAYTPDYISALKKEADYVSCSIGFVPELVNSNPYLLAYSKSYESTFKRTLDDVAANGALIAGALYDALERCTDLTRESLTKAIRETDAQPGANPYMTRGVKFAANGDNDRATIVVLQLRNEEQKIVYPANLATTKLVWPMPKWSQR